MAIQLDLVLYLQRKIGGGNILLLAEQDIIASKIISSSVSVNGNAGNAGAVTLEANRNIDVGSYYS